MRRAEESAVREAADAVLALQPSLKECPPCTGIVLGSGLGAAAERLLLQAGGAVDYRHIPGMPESRVVGHRGRLVHGRVDETRVVALQGRVHAYEGHGINRITFGVRLLQTLGIRQLILTNAAGGIRSGMTPGDLMLIDGHLRFPEIARVDESGGPADVRDRPRALSLRSVSGSSWNDDLLETALTVATPLRIHRGTYAMMPGPNYETPAEIRMLQILGADAVGMSTVPEAVCASQAGISVLGVSCITNVAAGLSDQKLDHSDVSHTASSIEAEFTDWLFRTITAITT